MKPAQKDRTGFDPTASHLGSEYMDARSYLEQPPRVPRVKQSDGTFHGSNDSDFGTDVLKDG